MKWANKMMKWVIDVDESGERIDDEMGDKQGVTTF